MKKHGTPALVAMGTLVALMISPAAQAAPSVKAKDDLSPAEQAALIEQIGRRLDHEYHDPTRVPAALAALQAQDRPISGQTLAEAWTRVLQVQLKDAHARLMYSPEALPPEPREKPDMAPEGPPAALLHHMNCGVERVEHYPGNIGYLRLDGMAPPEACAATLAGALQVLAHSDALVLDLRRNRGGSPAMVQWLASHFLPPQTPLSRMVSAREPSSEALQTRAGLPGPQLPLVPLYVLTSSKTFSAGEHLAYDLQQAGRATVVGEASGGGANPGAFRTVHPHFRLWVSLARSVSPVTGGNWEGKGVQPDEAAQAQDARRVAYGRALKDLVARKAPSVYPGEREEILDDLAAVAGQLGL